jgi:hypothetical protein
MPSAQPVRLQQCLFGYDDGHRLLSSSLDLHEDESSKILLLSDLAPNLDSGVAKEYWTGVPLTIQKHYALLRTWLAPEMPRPGCVWTHAILVSFADIGRFVDLYRLTSLFKRPTRSSGFAEYEHPLSVNTDISKEAPSNVIDLGDGMTILRVLYASRAPAVLSAGTGSLDEVIFRVWSQQWPQLRRSFSFRTACSPFESISENSEFDLRVNVTSPADAPLTEPSTLRVEPWEAAALSDLSKREPSDLRRFYWRYGSDLRRGRERFRFLTEIYLATRVAFLCGELLQNILLRVSKAFPNPASARILKEDLVSCGLSPYALVPQADPLDLLKFTVGRADLHSLPDPPPEITDNLKQYWPARAEEFLTVAELAVKHRSRVGEGILRRFDDIVFPEDPLVLTRNHEALRYYVISSNPGVLDSDEVIRIPERELIRYIDTLPISEAVAERVIDRLVTHDTPLVAQAFFDKSSASVVSQIAKAIIAANGTDGAHVSQTWLQLLASAIPLFFRLGLLEKATSTRTIADFLDLLGPTKGALWEAGSMPWAAALRHAQDDVAGLERQKLLTFFAAIGCHNPMPGCEPLFELAFEYIHDQLLRSKLPAHLLDMLLPNLPELHWWDGWDYCLRLRVAIVKAYTTASLSPKSFRKLTADKHLEDQLLRLLAKTKRGKRFMRSFV